MHYFWENLYFGIEAENFSRTQINERNTSIYKMLYYRYMMMPFSGIHIVHYIIIAVLSVVCLTLLFKEYFSKIRKKKIDKQSVLKCVAIIFIFLFTSLHIAPCPLHMFGKAMPNMQQTACVFCSNPSTNAVTSFVIEYSHGVHIGEVQQSIPFTVRQIILATNHNKSPPIAAI